MELLTTTGFSKNNYGKWMNTIMESSPCEWVMFHDHDIFLANPDWYNIIIKHIENNPEAGLFTCVTNRIGNPQQKIKTNQNNHDLEYHWEIAKSRENEKLTEATRPISGLIMVTSKTAWEKAGGFRERGIIGVDNHYYGSIKRAGYKAYIMNDLYVYHRYRAPMKNNFEKPEEIIAKIEGTNNKVILASQRIDGGGNQSPRKLAGLMGYDLVKLNTEEWKDCKAEYQVWYMNDDIYKMNNEESEAFEKVLSYAKDIKIVLNFVIGGTHNKDWVYKYPVSKIIFLNEQRRKEWDEATKGKPHNLVETVSLQPPIDLEKFEIVNRIDTDKTRIGRHSRISLKFPEDPLYLYDRLDREDRTFDFMLAHPKIEEHFKNNNNFNFYRWNEKPIEKYLEDLDIYLAIIHPKTKEQAGRSNMEAMASGCCVITENRDGPVDYIENGKTGFLVNSEDEAIEIINNLDLKTIREIGQNAREYAFKNFTADKWLKELIN